MKLVQITEIWDKMPDHFTERSNYYWVRLGNGRNVQFSSKRDADAFLVFASNFCQDQLIELNSLYAETFSEYRALWFYFDGRTDETMKYMQKKENMIRKWFKDVDFVFENMYKSRYLKDNEFAFKRLAMAAQNIIEISSVLIQIRKRRSEAIERKNIEFLKDRATALLHRLFAFADDYKHTYQPINQMIEVKNWLKNKK